MMYFIKSYAMRIFVILTVLVSEFLQVYVHCQGQIVGRWWVWFEYQGSLLRYIDCSCRKGSFVIVPEPLIQATAIVCHNSATLSLKETAELWINANTALYINVPHLCEYRSTNMKT